MNHEDVLNMLKPIAVDLANKRWRHVACIRFKNEIVSYGVSQLKSHPFQTKYSKNDAARFWHAETNAIFNSLKVITEKDLRRSTLYVCRVKRNDITKQLDFGLSKPCCGCYRCIQTFGIPTTVYSLDKVPGFKSYYAVIKQ